MKRYSDSTFNPHVHQLVEALESAVRYMWHDPNCCRFDGGTYGLCDCGHDSLLKDLKARLRLYSPRCDSSGNCSR